MNDEPCSMRRQVLVDKVTSLFSICTNYENCDWMNGRYIEHMQIVILKSKHPARFRNRPRNRLTVSIKLRFWRLMVRSSCFVNQQFKRCSGGNDYSAVNHSYSFEGFLAGQCGSTLWRSYKKPTPYICISWSNELRKKIILVSVHFPICVNLCKW